VIDELERVWKEADVTDLGIIPTFYCRNQKSKENFSQNNQFADGDMNL
jgi:hypothetical protein